MANVTPITFEYCGRQLPIFGTIREVARMGIMTEHHLRQREAQGKLPGIYCGNVKRVNIRLLLEQLDTESAAQIAWG